MPTQIKSNKQRKEEIRTLRSKRQERVEAGALAERLKGKVLVKADNLVNRSWGWPEFVRRGYYLDQSFCCKDCGEAQVWTATQQKWWYELAKGDVWTTAVLCRPCRRRERERKKMAREVSLAGMACKAASKEQPEK